MSHPIRKLLLGFFLVVILNHAVQSQNYSAGPGAGSASKGVANTFVGPYAGLNQSSGNNNSFFGYAAGAGNTTGHENVMVGTNAGYRSNAVNNIYIGYNSAFLTTTGNNNAFMGTRSGYLTTTGSFDVFVGTESGLNNTTGYQNTFIGRSAGLNNKTGNLNTSLGYYAGPSTAALMNATAIGYRAYVAASNSLVLGSISGINGATASTKVGIGVTAPGYQLQLSTNSAAKPGSSAWTIASDARLKDRVQEFTDGLDLVAKMHPVKFYYNGKAGMPAGKEYVGVIAQEMQKIAPYTVGEFIYQDTSGSQEKYLDYDAGALTYIFVNAIKELRIKDSTTQAKFAALQINDSVKIAALEEEISLLKQLVNTRINGVALYPAAKLWQNAPNPANGSTVIQYSVPAEVQRATIVVYGINGQLLYSVNVSSGDGQVTLGAGQLAQGAYTYHLMINGQSVASKKLVISR